MARVVILGAGLTGLSTAYHLEQNSFFDFKIFEQESTHGGLCRSVKHKGFTFDYTGHLLHSNNDYFHNLLNTLLPEKDRNLIPRNSAIYTHGTFIPYPIQMNLAGLPTQVIAECLCGFAKRNHQIKDPATFKCWVFKHFGTGLGKHFFFPYNSKLLCTRPEHIHPSFTGRFVPKTTIGDILEGLRTVKKSVGYNHQFYYPKKGGIQFFTDNLRAQIKSPIYTNHKAIFIDIKNKQVVFENGATEKYDTLISTAPLNSFLKMSNQPSNLNLTHVHQKLRHNSVVNFNLVVPKMDNDKHWIYIPEKKFPFYRVGFWTNFSQEMAPGYTSIYGELSYLPGKIPQEKITYLTKKSIKQVLDIFEIKKTTKMVAEKILHLKHAYVVYDEWRANNLSFVHDALHDHSIHSIGRYGEWKYSSMQEAILDGKEMAEHLVKDLATRISPAKRAEQPHMIIPSEEREKELKSSATKKR